MRQLNKSEQDFLLHLARATIVTHLQNQPLPAILDVPEGPLRETCGAFVTLTRNLHLRGCIGYTTSNKPLYATVMDCAISAATEDPRFPHLDLEELPQTKIEISVLSPFWEIQDIDQIEVGTHGLLITRGKQRGLLLPQVAREHRFDRGKFLEQTCLKAGLSPQAWKESETQIKLFTALVFSEEK